MASFFGSLKPANFSKIFELHSLSEAVNYCVHLVKLGLHTVQTRIHMSIALVDTLVHLLLAVLDLLLHVAIHRLVDPHKLVLIALQALNLPVELLLETVDLSFDQGSDATHATFPAFFTEHLCLLWHDNVHENVFLFLFTLLANGACHVVHEVKFGPSGTDVSVLIDARKRLTHDCDEHVEHSNLCEESSC